MIVAQTPGALKKFRRVRWRFQQTVARPVAAELEKFVATIFTGCRAFQGATVTIDEVIFSTARLSPLCPPNSSLSHDTSISAESLEEANSLLVACFWDGMDFVCTPTPKPFVCYADHDDWITFYANKKSHLNHVIEPLESNGYEIIRDWRRNL